MVFGGMRGKLATVAFAGLSLTVIAPAGHAVSPKQDSVTGTAQHLGADPPYPVIQVRIDARSKADGTHARGHLAVEGTMPVQTYSGRVTCLNVLGNQATVGIEIVKSTDPAMEGQGQLWSVVDGGDTGAFDRIAGYPLTPTAPMVCPPLLFNVPVVSGDYVVNDATP
jgi:hypothetical protein